MIEILYFIPILLSAYAVGFNIFKLFNLKATNLENSIFSVVLGFAFYSYLTFFLGILGWLYASVYWFVILLSLILWYRACLDIVKSMFNQIKNYKLKFNFETFLIVVIALFVILAILSALVPPFLWDELDYHLAMPKIWARHHELIPVYSRWISELPSNVDILYLIGIILKNGILSKFFALSYGLLLAAAIYSFGKRFYNNQVGLLAAVIYLTLPMIMNHIGAAYVDISVAGLVFMALYCFIVWLKSREINWLYTSSIFTGLSIATKHTALFPAIVLGIFVVFFTLRKLEISDAIKKILVFALIALIFGVPWYVKSYIQTSNPVWPLAYNIFGGKYWDSHLAAEFSKKLNLASDMGVFNFLITPWNITMHSSSFRFLLGWNSIFLAFVPLLLFFRKIEKDTILLLLHSLIIFYSITFSSYYLFGILLLRYAIIYPALSIISALVIHKLLKFDFFKIFIFLILAISFMFTAIAWAGVFGQKMFYVVGLEDEATFYNKLVDYNGYPVFQYINTNLPINSTIFLFRESRGYLSDRDYIVGLPSDQKVVDYSKIINEENFYQQLKRNNVTHILINTKIEFYKPQEEVKNRLKPFSEEHQRIMDNLLKKRATMLYENNGIYLYSLN